MQELKSNTYPGRGIVIGKSEDGKHMAIAYFIMGRSENSRNRVFVDDGEGIKTQAYDPQKLEDPSLIIYAPVLRVWRKHDCHQRRQTVPSTLFGRRANL